MTDERCKVEGRRRCLHRIHVLAHRREPVPRRVTQQVHRRRRFAARERSEAHAAVAGDHRRHSLADLRRHVRSGEHRTVVVGVRVDESRRDDETRRVDLAGRIDAQVEVVADRDDAVAGHRNVEVGTGRTRSVDDVAGVDQEIARGRNSGHWEILHEGALSVPAPHGQAAGDGARFRLHPMPHDGRAVRCC